MPKGLHVIGSPDHNAIIASSYKVDEGGMHKLVADCRFHSSLEHGRISPRASTVVTTGGEAYIRVIDPDNMYTQKYVLEIRSRYNMPLPP